MELMLAKLPRLVAYQAQTHHLSDPHDEKCKLYFSAKNVWIVWVYLRAFFALVQMKMQLQKIGNFFQS